MYHQLRVNAFNLLEKALDTSTLTLQQRFEISRLIEYYIYLHTDIHTYREKVLQIEWNLRINHTYLLNTYQISELPTLTDEQLGRTSIAEQQIHEINDLIQLQESLFQDGEDEEDDEFDTDGGLRCSKCRSNNIALEQKQTRN
jgi:hypothetical protein